MAGPYQPTAARSTGKKQPLCEATLTSYCVQDPKVHTDRPTPPLLGPTQTTLCGNHTNIFPGLKLGADGHLVVATADDLESGEVVMSTPQQPPSKVLQGPLASAAVCIL